MKECEKRNSCDRFFRRGAAACEGCGACGEAPKPPRTASYEESRGACEEGSDGIVADDYGNEGTRLYDVTLTITRTQSVSDTVTVAADSEKEAGKCAEEALYGQACDNDDWSTDDDSVDVESVEEKIDD